MSFDCPGTKETTGQGFFFVPGQRDNKTNSKCCHGTGQAGIFWGCPVPGRPAGQNYLLFCPLMPFSKKNSKNFPWKPNWPLRFSEFKLFEPKKSFLVLILKTALMGKIEGDFVPRDVPGRDSLKKSRPVPSRGKILSLSRCPFVPGQKKLLSRCLLCSGTIKGRLSLCPAGQENPVSLETLFQIDDTQLFPKWTQFLKFDVATSSRKK